MDFRILGSGLLLCVLFQSSCATPLLGSRERKEMTGLEEMSLEYLKGEWGDPDSDVATGEKRIVHYKNVRSEDLEPISRQVTVKHCVVKLEINKAEMVSSWEYESCEIDK